MGSAKILRNILLALAVLALGVKLGIKYAQDHYVIKDRKFIEGESTK